MSTDELLASARAAFDQADWATAIALFAEADRSTPLVPEDLAHLADAHWWIGDPDAATDALERAFAGHHAAGNSDEAAMVAIQIAYFAYRRRAKTVGFGWHGRAASLLQGRPEGRAHAWLAMLDAARATYVDRDRMAALSLFDRAIDLGDRVGAFDASALARGNKGYLLITDGDWQKGFELLDVSTAAALSGELEPRVASDVYCTTIAACRDSADYERAGEWTEEADRWMRRHSLGGYPGICRVHRAELKRMRGSWSEAEMEARRACDELERFGLLDGVGIAHNEIGAIRLCLGDIEAAERAFEEAYKWGGDSQLGLALVRRARGDLDGAASDVATMVDSMVATASPGRLIRGLSVLSAQIEIAYERGDAETARTASARLQELAVDFDRPYLQAAAATAGGTVALLDGDHPAAIDHLNVAWRQWRELGFHYEAAKARAMLGIAESAADDRQAAVRDLRAARSAFERLGAVRDLGAVDALLGEDGAADRRQSRVVRTFMFTDIVGSTDLIGVIGDEAWGELLHWHDRSLRADVAASQGVEVRHTGDGFFFAFERASDAAHAAVAIQRRLARHRLEHGFSPQVRIGFHTAEATREGLDFSGGGVHVAARVAALAGADEIVMSAAAQQAAGPLPYPLSEPRQVELKGVTKPIEVVTTDWR
jgi:class 3 adenylate cyclase